MYSDGDQTWERVLSVWRDTQELLYPPRELTAEERAMLEQATRCLTTTLERKRAA